MTKKTVSVLMALILALSVFLTLPMKPVTAEATTKVTIHYKAAEGSTDDWNMWIWPFGGEGAAYDFTGQDGFGKFVTVELEGDHQKVGFIVRTDEWKKDGDTDRFIEDIIGGEAEIWLYGGDAKVYYEDPEGGSKPQPHANVDVTVHYFRYDNNYDGWTVNAGPEGKEKAPFSFTGEDAYGKIAKFTVPGMKDIHSIGFILENKTLGLADETESFIKKFADTGKAEIWLFQGNPRVYYKEDQTDRKPRVSAATLTETNKIQATVNVPFKPAGGNETFVVDAGGTKVEVTKATPVTEDGNGYVSVFDLEIAENIPLAGDIKVSRDGYDAGLADKSGIFDSASFAEQMSYDGNDLGATYSEEETKFRVWAPTATAVSLVTYTNWDDAAGTEVPMTAAEKGTWTAAVKGDLHNTFYMYKVTVNGKTNEAVDPYARAVSVNGEKGAIVNLASTNPKGWDKQPNPQTESPVDAVFYELHVRDLSIQPESGMKNKGKYLAFTETDTTGPEGTKTGLNHIKDLGITHVQLLPFFDYASVDETKLDKPQFNWGYDPENYNAVDGSYSTDPFTPDVRIKEAKQAIQAMHENGLQVVMDVVYNHMYAVEPSNFNKIVPGYYFRLNEDGTVSNGTGVGNDTESRRAMMRKFMIDSTEYLAKEYKLDGFRFDLMGIHDVDTMNAVRANLDKIDPTIITIGEGWNLGTNLEDSEKASQGNAGKMPRIAHFNDSVRDGLKGSVFEAEQPGWVNGDHSLTNRIKAGVVGDIRYNSLIDGFTDQPDQSVNYVEAHDNNTLYDKLKFTNPNDSEEDITKMHKLTANVIFTSQGIPFLHAGQEFMRTKGGDHNSYQSPDAVNQLDWNLKLKNMEVVNYYKGLIELRKAHPAFRMRTADEIKKNITFIDGPKELVAFTIQNNANGDTWDNIAVAHNASRAEIEVTLPDTGKKWNVVVDGKTAGVKSLQTIEGTKVKVPALASLVLYSGETKQAAEEKDSKDSGLSAIWILAFVAIGLVLAATAATILIRRRKA